MNKGGQVYAGIDVSKAGLDIAIRPTGEQWQSANDAEGIRELSARLAQLRPSLVVLEATGGYEVAVAAELSLAGLAVAIVNPRQVREFARAAGKLAKTDVIDSRILAHFAEAMRPEPRPLADDISRKLKDLVTRREQLLGMLTAERNRFHAASREMRPEIQEHIDWLRKRIKALEDELTKLIQSSAVWREKENLLRTVPGVGPVLSRTLLASLPELGSLSAKEVASLVGVAPHCRDSGTYHGKRSVWGGRSAVRAKLYMATVVAIKKNEVISGVYQRLLAAGKGPKVAIVACMRKLLVVLNAMMRDEQTWAPRSKAMSSR